jgi:hypothetical protein
MLGYELGFLEIGSFTYRSSMDIGYNQFAWMVFPQAIPEIKNGR